MSTNNKRAMPVRLSKIELEGDWAGWTFTGKTNPTIATMEDLTSGDFGRIKRGLCHVVYPPWNFVDEGGGSLPAPRPNEPHPPNEQEKDSPDNGPWGEEIIAMLPFDLAIEMAGAVAAKITEARGN